MSKPVILVSSITYAMKGRDILQKHGIKSSVERTPRTSENTGCGYSIYVSSNADEAELILRQYGIKILGRAERDAK
jgi:hypothetical protein